MLTLLFVAYNELAVNNGQLTRNLVAFDTCSRVGRARVLF